MKRLRDTVDTTEPGVALPPSPHGNTSGSPVMISVPHGFARLHQKVSQSVLNQSGLPHHQRTSDTEACPARVLCNQITGSKSGDNNHNNIHEDDRDDDGDDNEDHRQLTS